MAKRSSALPDFETAREEGLALGEDHWEVLRALHEYFARHEGLARNMRELHDALDEKFHRKGGIRYLYQLFPGGPIAQGCRIAGLRAPAGGSTEALAAWARLPQARVSATGGAVKR